MGGGAAGGGAAGGGAAGVGAAGASGRLSDTPSPAGSLASLTLPDPRGAIVEAARRRWIRNALVALGVAMALALAVALWPGEAGVAGGSDGVAGALGGVAAGEAGAGSAAGAGAGSGAVAGAGSGAAAGAEANAVAGASASSAVAGAGSNAAAGAGAGANAAAGAASATATATGAPTPTDAAAPPAPAADPWPPLPTALVDLPAAEVTLGLTPSDRQALLDRYGDTHAFDLADDAAALTARRWMRPAMQAMPTEVTWAMWLADPPPLDDCPGSPPAAGAPRYPVTEITPLEAARFCEARGMRLPSDHEWEAIARGPSNPVRLAERLDTASYPLPAAARPDARTAEGVFDLAGSVREWVRCTPGEPAYCLGGFAQRGGAFGDDPIWWHPALAHPPLPGESARCHRAFQVGFRCVR